jgi:hypothetical protein
METKLAIPTMSDLVTETPETVKLNNLQVLLNQNPPSQWLENHPMIRGYKYIPIQRIEWLLTRIFTKWWVDIIDTKLVANSITVTVSLSVINPLDGKVWHQQGVGASPLQTDKGAGATEFDKIKNDAVMKAIPSAESYAIKDAAEKFGKIFGKDVGRKSTMDYNSLLKTQTTEKDLV